MTMWQVRPLVGMVFMMAALSPSGLRHGLADDAPEPGPANAAAPAAEAVEVELMEPGSMPRRLIRFQPAKGVKQTVVMTMNMKQVMKLDGNPLPSVDLPPQQFVIDLSVVDVSEEGDIQFAFVYSAADVVDDPKNPSPVAAVMRQALQPMVGTTGSGVVTSRGLTLKGDLDLPPEVPAQLRAILDGMKEAIGRISSPVPEEPIGVGGRWRVVQHVVANGIRLRQVSIHELKEIGDAGFAVEVQLTQKGGPQAVTLPGVPADGPEVHLESLSTTGDGETLLSGDSIVARRARMAMRSTMTMRIEPQKGQQQSMEVDTRMEMHIGPATPAATTPAP